MIKKGVTVRVKETGQEGIVAVRKAGVPFPFYIDTGQQDGESLDGPYSKDELEQVEEK